jgi:hypothetical protein
MLPFGGDVGVLTMDQQQTDAAITLQDVRRLWLERAQKQRELDAIDRAIALALGINGEDRPAKQRLSRSDIRTLFRTTPNECLPKKKRHESALARAR